MKEIKKAVAALIKYEEDYKIDVELYEEGVFDIYINVWVDGELKECFTVATFEVEAEATKKFKSTQKTVKGWGF